MIKQVMPLMVGLFLCGSLMAQVPKQINYQGIARNAYGTALSNQTITLRLTIRDGNATGPVIYQESRSVTTNQFGLFSTAIGGEGATAVSGSLNGNAWNTASAKFLQVEMDPRGGNQFSSLGASPLTSVPFAFRAESAAPAGVAGGDLSGDYPNPTIKAGAITADKIAVGTITADKIAAGVIPSSLPVSGTAGGDLTGNYPNPTIANDAISTNKIAAGAVTGAKLAPNAVGTGNVQDGAITAAKLAPGVIPSSLPVSGTAGGDLTGTYPNPTIANNAVIASKIADNAISTSKLADNAVNSNKIAAGAVTNAKLAANAVGTTNVQDGAITAAKLAPGVIPASLPVSGTAGGDLTGTYPNPTIANNAITNAKLATNSVGTAQLIDGSVNGNKITDNAVGTNKIASGAVTSAKLAAGAITTTTVADGAITAAKLAPGVIPSSLPVSGTAGGDLTGTYPNPTIANNAVTAAKLADNAVSATKLADNAVSSAKLSDNAVITAKLANNAVTAAKIADNSISTGKIADNAVGATKIADNAVGATKIADNAVGTNKIAAGAVTNAKLAANSVNTANVVDGSITAAKLAPGVIPSSLPVSGTAGGDLTGTYPNPTIANNAVTAAKLADNSVSATKLADNAVSAAKLADNAVSSAKLSDNAVTTGKLANNAVTAAKIADNSVITTKIADNSVTAAKLADNSVSTTKIADNAVSATKIADNAIATAKIADFAVTENKISAGSVTSVKIAIAGVNTNNIADGAITANKLAPGVIPASLPISGAAGGDLTGAFPNPTVSAINGVPVAIGTPTSGQVLKFNGTAWAPGTDNGGSGGSFELPYTGAGNSNTELFSISNTGNGVTIGATNNSNGNAVVAVSGRITSPSPSFNATGIYGEIDNTSVSNGIAVFGRHRGNGTGIQGNSVGGDAVRGESENGFGLYGYSATQNGVFARSNDGAGLYSTSLNGPAARFEIDDPNYSEAINVYNTNGVGLDIITMNNAGLRILTFNEYASPIEVNHAGGGLAIYGETNSDYAPSLLGRNTGFFAGIHGYAPKGIGVLAETNVEGYTNGIGFKSVIGQSGGADHAVFETDGAYVARIDENGRGYFNGGTTNSGADVAELFSVEGARNSYEPGDVLEISTNGDRKMVKSSGPYSTLVAGVYATKPGVLLTEENATVGDLSSGVPMGVIGVLPTKVCLEGGPIKRGDLIVTSSISGVAMKGDPDKVKIGQVLGKALQDYTGNGIGKINVLVSVK